MTAPMSSADRALECLSGATTAADEIGEWLAEARRYIGQLEGENAALRAEIQAMRVGTLLSTTDTE